MTLHVRPEAHIPMPDKEPTPPYMSMLAAASGTAKLLAEAGLEFVPTTDDVDDAAETTRSIARNPDAVATAAASVSITRKTPAALLLTEAILQEFGHKVVQEAETVRHLVMNKLVQETENPDARVRIRALELLGKMGDVGMFTDKKEVTVTHQTSDDVKERLRARLARLLPAKEAPVEDAVVVEATPIPAPAPEPPPMPPPVIPIPDDGDDDDDDDDDDEYDYELSLDPRRAAPSLFEGF